MSVTKKIIINSAVGETRVAMTENDQVSELRLFRDHNPSYVGAIYLGRVTRLSSEFQAAFVELDNGLTGFLPLKTLPKTPGKKPKDLTSLLHEGERIIVQVTADAASDKSVKLTGRVELISTAIVLHPFRSGAFVSSRIKDPTKREELKEFGATLALGDLGITFRTEAQNVSLSQLKDTADKLIRHWKTISKNKAKQKCPNLLTQGPEPIEQIMRDFTTADTAEIIIDHASALKTAVLWAKTFAPDLVDKISHYTGKQSIFGHYEIDDVLEQITAPYISTKSGAWITFEKTEAMTVVDVNMGHAQGSNDAETQIFTINREAAREIFRQLRLRGTGGIIIIDFINMTNKGHVKSLLQFIDELMLSDPMPLQRGNISSLGLLELSRKARQQDLDSLLLKKAPPTENLPTECLSLLRTAEKDAMENPGQAAIITVTNQQKKWFEDHSILIDQFRERTHVNLQMEPS
tara:strand:- start:20011 stop:21399 length:1389 start_codon:yes stop_codon:yes gene_type:complete